ncbi:chromate efflux transporter [uncultured Shimia sp.]|uniref:chromate efflux transporter n=1 Tax=uncultured Shimia sp. TaxID=573152 RepID=UPI002635B911|nr:chromate efflux transporter [uncultured Shimia sp.]
MSKSSKMEQISLSQLVRVFGRIGLLSFGGPAAQISLMHRELVEQRPWLEEKEFLGALSFCMMLPGPEAMQLATYTGWKLRGTLGGLIGGLLFVLPGALIIAALAALYVAFGEVSAVQHAFVGVQAAVVAVVLQALIRLSGKVLNDKAAWLAAMVAFAALFTQMLPFPAVILLAALAGATLPALQPTNSPKPASVPFKRTARTVLIWGLLWAAPVALLIVLQAQFLIDLALFFSKLAVVTFGGAYAVLAYMVQAVVQEHQWLTTPQMMDALGLAETTPGPLILVTQFVGHLAGYQAGGTGLAVLAGLVTLWCTFTPCFLWIFAGAPYVERLLHAPRLGNALRMISASVVGVIANLGLWFALHVLFSKHQSVGPVTLPNLSSFELLPALLVLLGCGLLLGLRLPLVIVLVITAVAAIFAAPLM